MGYQLTEAEERLAEILWKHVPMSSAELVKICGEEIDWKKSTTYTMLKKLEQKGVFVNEKGMICHIYQRRMAGSGKQTVCQRQLWRFSAKVSHSLCKGERADGKRSGGDEKAH